MDPDGRADWAKIATGFGMMVGGAVVAVGTVVEDAVTGGWGTWNDPASFGAAGTLVLGGAALMAEGIREEAEIKNTLVESISLSSQGRLIIFRHYSRIEYAESILSGLWPGTYVTTAEGPPMTGKQAQQLLALPHEEPPNCYYEVVLPEGYPVIGPHPVEPTEVPPRTGGGVEYILPEGAPAGCIRGPFPIPLE
ncbi:hypothetical protein [Spirochaeta thermophila]|uniref:hypothetical protein n=1 Tax=Winmispira thermophila TaxID=154 RepID=UPI0011D0D275|nr:hypothetical protein [Spirochaeta thermophila]